jgi:hypothetical protein
MSMFAGLDVGGKTTAMCVLDEAGRIVWQGTVDTHPDAIAARLKGFRERLIKVGIESGPFTPYLYCSLAAKGFPDGVHGCTPGRGCDHTPARGPRYSLRMATCGPSCDRSAFGSQSRHNPFGAFRKPPFPQPASSTPLIARLLVSN